MSPSPFWSRHVFVLLSPDATYRGVHLDLIHRLRKEDFSPVAGRVVRVEPALIDELYADLIVGAREIWRYRLVDASLGLGPAVALICRYAGTGDAHEQMAARKGYQHPGQARPGTIRRDLGAVNSLVGLMHSSDGPAESAREATIFGLAEQDAVEPAEATVTVDYMCRIIAPHTPEHRDFDATLASVRTRVLGALWQELPDDARVRIRSRFPDPAALGAVGAGAELADLLGGHAPPRLALTLRCEFEPDWRDRLRMGQVADALRAIGVTLDRWERLVLETSLHFPPRRLSRAGSGDVDAA